MGDGLRELGNPQQNFIPPTLGPIQKEYASEAANGNPELLVEQIDPTVEAEKASEEEHGTKEEEVKDEEPEE